MNCDYFGRDNLKDGKMNEEHRYKKSKMYNDWLQ